MSTLSRQQLVDYLARRDDSKLVVTPLLEPELQVNQIGIDLRLSNQFIIFRTENIDVVDPRALRDDKERIKAIQAEVVMPFGVPFFLHPQAMVIGSTFEYLSLPTNIEASVEGRSSFARIGLVIASAVTIEPGFKGCITLELANISNVPVALYPGSRIAQLVCRETTSTTDYEKKRKYLVPIGPEFSKIHRDLDSAFIYAKR